MSLRVESALIRAYPLRFQQISVLAFYGIVELSGSVENWGDRTLAVQIAERIPGVTTVIESVRVREDVESRRVNERLRPKIRSLGLRAVDSVRQGVEWK